MTDVRVLLERHKPRLVYDSHEVYFADSAAIWPDSPTNVLKRLDGTVLAKAPKLALTFHANPSSVSIFHAVPAIPLLVRMVRRWASSVAAPAVKPCVWFAAPSGVGILYVAWKPGQTFDTLPVRESGG